MGREAAEFLERSTRIGCGWYQPAELSSRSFDNQPLRGFVERDPWGENPCLIVRERDGLRKVQAM